MQYELVWQDITFGLQTISDFFPYCIYMQLSNITLE